MATRKALTAETRAILVQMQRALEERIERLDRSRARAVDQRDAIVETLR